MKNKQKLIPAVAVFAFVAFCFSIANTFGVSYAYTDSDCPSGYSLVSGTNQCYGKPTSVSYGCTYGSYDQDEGWCYYTQTCPARYELVFNNQCAVEPLKDASGNYNCTYGTYDDDEGYCYYNLSIPQGYEVYSSSTAYASMTYKGKPYVSGATCAYGDYDDDEGWCYYYLTSGSGTGSGTGGGTTTEPEEKTVTLTFDLNGGDSLLKNGQVSTKYEYEADGTTDGDPFKISEFTAEKENLAFKGWVFNKDNCNDLDKYKVPDEIYITQNLVLYACWGEDEVSVQFHLDDDETLLVDGEETTQTKYTFDINTDLNLGDYEAKKEGFDFAGWSESKTSCDETILMKGSLSSDLDLYPCWEESKEDEDNKEDTTNKDDDKTTNDKEDDEIDKNSQTGSTMLYIVFLIGILSLCYTVYYSYKAIKSNK